MEFPLPIANSVPFWSNLCSSFHVFQVFIWWYWRHPACAAPVVMWHHLWERQLKGGAEANANKNCGIHLPSPILLAQACSRYLHSNKKNGTARSCATIIWHVNTMAASLPGIIHGISHCVSQTKHSTTLQHSRLPTASPREFDEFSACHKFDHCNPGGKGHPQKQFCLSVHLVTGGSNIIV